jgi:stearoyl-CoA desaturase (delta-9 desaturase)
METTAIAANAGTPNSPSRAQTWFQATPFVLSHMAVFGAIWSGVTWPAVVLCVVLLLVRQWAVTAGYHRYFAHRTYKTSRAMQFFLAFLAQTSSQKGVLWWAAHHRVHHKLSDQPGDVHSPVQSSFFYAHVGWVFDDATVETRWDKIRDFAKYPELRLLDKYWVVPPTILAVFCLLVAGWPGLFIGFFLSTVLLWHNTFLINSLTHIWGKRRFDTGDDSRNNALTAFLTLGEGWHNNHHHYQSSCRNGFYWYEIDVTYYVLKMMSWVGLVWDIREVPDHVLEEGRRRAKGEQDKLGEPVNQSSTDDELSLAA